MENIAHTLAGGVMARAGLAGTTRFATTALVLGSNLPDIDFVAGFGGPVRYLVFHRGITHSFAGSLGGGIALGLFLWGLDRWIVSRGKPAKDRARLGPLVALSLLACLVHMGFDFLNDYGLRPWLPFSDRWYYGDLVFIVDPWFWMILGGGLHLSMRRGLVREIPFWCGWALASVPVMTAAEVPGATRVAWVAALLVLAALRWSGIGSGWRSGSGIATGPSRSAESSEAHSPTLSRLALSASGSAETGEAGSRIPSPLAPSPSRSARTREDGSGTPSPLSPGVLEWPETGEAGSRNSSRIARRASRSAKTRESGGRLPARLALAALALYCLALLALHTAALARARTEIARREAGVGVRRLAATPRPADPLRWNVFYERGSEIVAASISVLDSAPPPALTSPLGAAPSSGSSPARGSFRPSGPSAPPRSSPPRGSLLPAGPSASPGSARVAGSSGAWLDPIVLPTNLDDPAVVEALETPTGRAASGFCRYLVATRRETAGGPVIRFSDARFERRGRTNWVSFDVPLPPSAAR